MKNKTQKGFTLIEMVLVIVAVGIIGSMAATMLFQGADVFISETNRQGFVSANRSAFWKLMRETQGQNSPNDFTLSDHNSLYLRNVSGTQKEYQTSSPGTFNYREGSGSYNSLSNSYHYEMSTGFQFYNSNFSLITPSSGGLSLTQAKTVKLSKLDMSFVSDTDTLSLSTYVYPQNFRFGTKMTFHE